MLRKLLVFVLLLCCMHVVAQAEFGCICQEDRCICFMQPGDEGIGVKAAALLLIQEGYMPPDSPIVYFSAKMEAGVKAFQKAHDLPETGMLDDATLTWLIWGMSPDRLDEEYPLLIGSPVWIPTDGGVRHHRIKDCCEMYDPRLVSLRNAMALDILRCGRCRPNGLNTVLD